MEQQSSEGASNIDSVGAQVEVLTPSSSTLDATLQAPTSNLSNPAGEAVESAISTIDSFTKIEQQQQQQQQEQATASDVNTAGSNGTTAQCSSGFNTGDLSGQGYVDNSSSVMLQHEVNKMKLEQSPGCVENNMTSPPSTHNNGSSYASSAVAPSSCDNIQLQQQQQQQQQSSIVPAATGMGGTQTPVAHATPSLNANYPLGDSCPTQDVKLFVGKIPNEFIESDLLPLFEAWGTVKECVIIRDKCNSQSKGSAFVRMNRLCDADAAIKELHQRRNLGSDSLGPMQVKYAAGEAERIGLSETTANPGVDEAKLFVGSLHRNASEDDLRSIFNRFGEITEVFLIRDPATGLGRGCAFVKFAYKESGLWACRDLNNIGTHAGSPRQMEVRFAESKKQQPMGGGPSSNQQPISSGGSFATGQLSQGMGGPQQQQQQSSLSNQGGPLIGGGVLNPSMNTPISSPGINCGSSSLISSGVVASGVSNSMTATHSNDNPRQAGCWKEYFNDQGRPYYHSESSNVTTWDIPPEFDALDSSSNNPLGVPSPPAPRSSSAGPHSAGSSNHISNDQAGPPGANVFIFHVPNEWSQPELLQAFSPWGTIVSARVAVDKVTQRNKGYAFVSYDSIQSAATAVQQMNGFMAGTKRLKVSIKQGEEQYVSHLFTMGIGGGNNQGSNGVGLGGRAGGSQGSGGFNDGSRGGGGMPY